MKLLTTLAVLSALTATAASALPVVRTPGPFGDKPAGPQSLPGDNLPPFGMLGPDGKMIPTPRLEGPPPAGAPKPPVAGPDLQTAVLMARAAVDACTAKGFKTGAAVIDSAGAARAMLEADGADGSHLFVAMRKAVASLVFETPSSEASAAVSSGRRPVSLVTPDMFVMGGAIPIRRDGRIVGAIGVSGAAGAPPGMADEACAAAGVQAAWR